MEEGAFWVEGAAHHSVLGGAMTPGAGKGVATMRGGCLFGQDSVRIVHTELAPGREKHGKTRQSRLEISRNSLVDV